MNNDVIQPPKRLTTADQAYETILAAIVEGKFRPEQPLRINALAELLDMSMMPVREALSRLEALGVIESEPYRGVRIRKLSITDLIDTYRTRILLEGFLARQAATCFTTEAQERALAFLDLQEERNKINDLEGARNAHKGFHFTIYEAAQAPWAVRSAEPTWANSERYRIEAKITPEVVAFRRQEHEEILAACVAGDPDRAELALRDHLILTVQAIDHEAAGAIAHDLGFPLPALPA
ncbi:GntR family transcriptional regulator [Corynebacterium sp. A21]|uniref:GntR family transcriptional regulator n=1 Tax=Corynebacterium sp. A21 TaxID=3457318 RepID=UPI003FD4CF98